MNNSNHSFNWELFDRVPVIGILRDVRTEDAEKIIPLYVEVGFTNVEVTINSQDAENLINKLVKDFGERLNIGAGSVLDVRDLQRALDAGANFIVTPNTDEEVIRTCVDKGIPVFPGAFSPTEIVKAWKLGATMVKVFPAEQFGLPYIKALKAPLKHIKLLPTGGVTIENAKDYFLVGVDGLGVSTGLFKSDLIKNKYWGKLREHLDVFYKIIREIKNE